MPVHSTLSPVEASARAVDALLTALDGNPAPQDAATAYRAARTRHGRNLASVVGPEASVTVLVKVRADAPDKAAGEVRAAIVLKAWQGVESEAQAA